MTEANGDVTSYEYDDVYRLMSEVKEDDEQTVLYRYQYTYDGVGNRLSENNSGTIYYTYDSNNKLTQFVLGNDTTSFGYDNNGNTTSMTLPDETVWNYGYDYENRLTSVTDNDTYTAAYTYAADGTRVRAQESNAANTDKWFQYDGVRPVLEATLSSDTFTTLNRYVLEGDSYYDPLVFASIGGSNRYFMYDGLGSTRQLLDADQTTTDTYSYEAFGNLMSSSGSTANPYKYVGSLGYYQTGTSPMHLGARHYMPEVGRFITQDPIRHGRNWYLYGDDDPVTATDPDGTKCTKEDEEQCREDLERDSNRCVRGLNKKGKWGLIGAVVGGYLGGGWGALSGLLVGVGTACDDFHDCLSDAWEDYRVSMRRKGCEPAWHPPWRPCPTNSA